ncbi:hypothetical protein B484DRAFT_7833 [Ochromonadaceae sp. CCMP2298]|nr:hypothetical protein B484DRAFT_7833 [Ochromonadaceae sp. CCMP2298]|eukprot:CAMPEP_0173181598 /NCGR_PEP_ID=MMETSP1141-20130122/7365_1 /TAXON_ID=483371 /ORGANISM="non described non described, Strain CCMP2298" /LENGTH=246 /DNA_ID=CAMNT_0014104587 /DNA_START=55 /DNA_END=795 /DNA_ORIENTATION=-
MNTLFHSSLLALLIACAAAKIDLGDAAPYAILAGSTITSAGAIGTDITGDIGLYPGSDLVGFPPAVHTGTKNIANTAAFNAKASLTIAYNEAAGQAVDTVLSNQDLGGMTLFPGVYKFAADAALNGVLTLDAQDDPEATWTFQVGSAMLFALNSQVIFLHGFGNADLVYWQVGSSATIEGGATVEGNIMADQSISANTGASINGRLLARIAAVTMHTNTVVVPPVTVPAPAPQAAEVKTTHLRRTS